MQGSWVGLGFYFHSIVEMTLKELIQKQSWLSNL